MRYYQYQHTHAVRRHMCGLQTPTADKVIKKLLQNDFHEHLFISLELLHYQLWKLKGILFHTATEKRDGTFGVSVIVNSVQFYMVPNFFTQQGQDLTEL